MKRALLLMTILFIAGCGSNVTKNPAASKLHLMRPRTILVLPPSVIRADSDADERFVSSIVAALLQKGYYVFPPPEVWKVLEQGGLLDRRKGNATAPQRYGEYCGADAVLYTSIEEWHMPQRTHEGRIKLSCQLKSAVNGAILWKFEPRQSVAVTIPEDPGESRSARIEHAVVAVAEDIASTMPPGRYASPPEE